MPDTRKLRVFLCHASQDKPVVRELYQRLLAEGWIDPWLDEEKLLPGQDWDMEIEKALETADTVVVCLSKNSVSKEGFIQKELRYVLDVADEKPEEAIFVIPLRLDDCPTPRRLKNWQYVDYFPDNNKMPSYNRLKKSLESRFSGMALKVKDTNTAYSMETNNHFANYAEYLLIDEREKLNQLLAVQAKRFIWMDKSGKKSIQNELIKSISPLIREVLWLLFLFVFFVGSFYSVITFNKMPETLVMILIPFLIIAIYVLGIGALYRRLINSKLKDRIALQEEKIRLLGK